MKFNIRDIFESLNDVDTGFYACYSHKSHFYFDSDERGNGNLMWPWLRLSWYKSFIKVSAGSLLKSNERKKKWTYNNYETVDDLVDDIVIFTKKYAKSFKLVRK